MPNHVHGVIILDGDGVDLEALHTRPLSKNILIANISPKQNTLSSIIQSYKSAVTKHAHRLGYEFEWQSLYYDHIIRNELSYQRITVGVCELIFLLLDSLNSFVHEEFL